MGAAELRPAAGNRQYVNKCPLGTGAEDANQMMLLSDMALAWDPGFRVHLEAFAADEAPNFSRDTAATQPRHSRHIRSRRAQERRGHPYGREAPPHASSFRTGQAMLAREFGAAFKKLTELGCEGVLQPEVAAGGLAAAR